MNTDYTFWLGAEGEYPESGIMPLWYEYDPVFSPDLVQDELG